MQFQYNFARHAGWFAKYAPGSGVIDRTIGNIMHVCRMASWTWVLIPVAYLPLPLCTLTSTTFICLSEKMPRLTGSCMLCNGHGHGKQPQDVACVTYICCMVRDAWNRCLSHCFGGHFSSGWCSVSLVHSHWIEHAGGRDHYHSHVHSIDWGLCGMKIIDWCAFDYSCIGQVGRWVAWC